MPYTILPQIIKTTHEGITQMKCIAWTALLTASLVWPALAGPAFKDTSNTTNNTAYSAALDRFETILKASPNNLRVGSEYRQMIITTVAYDRAIDFFTQLVSDHPKAPNALLNFGYTFVDKIPIEGAITQVLLANTALTHFSAALELEKTWLGHFTRGNSYLYWPAIFGRTPLAIADLEAAIALAKNQQQKPYHVRPWIGLGDAYWRLKDISKAHQIWQKAAQKFPGNPDLQTRLQKKDEALNIYLEEYFDPNKRVDTDLSILWTSNEGKD